MKSIRKVTFISLLLYLFEFSQTILAAQAFCLLPELQLQRFVAAGLAFRAGSEVFSAETFEADFTAELVENSLQHQAAFGLWKIRIKTFYGE